MRLLFWRRRAVPVLELHGTIAARPGALSAASIGPLIDRAVAAAEPRGTLLLHVESPGGSAVQSDLIARRLRQRAGKANVKLVAVIGEVGASGGYWLACAADEIVANPMSIVGSIGVVGAGFGFPEALARLGIERRVYTAGANKVRLDPFRPERADDVAFAQSLLDDLHERFKDWVRSRRGERLRGTDGAMFDGGFMLGARALELGLIDRLGDLDTLVQEIGGERARARTFKPRRNAVLARLPRLAAAAILDAVEEHGRPRL